MSKAKILLTRAALHVAAPALGVVSGAVTAWGSGHHKLPVTGAGAPVFWGLMAAVLAPPTT
jgi:hypothetical protein